MINIGGLPLRAASATSAGVDIGTLVTLNDAIAFFEKTAAGGRHCALRRAANAQRRAVAAPFFERAVGAKHARVTVAELSRAAHDGRVAAAVGLRERPAATGFAVVDAQLRTRRRPAR